MKKQRGMTFIGVVLLVAGIVFVAVIGMKLMPAYLEFIAVKKAVAKIQNDPSFGNMTIKEIQDSFYKSSVMDDIHSVTAEDVVVQKNESGKPVILVEYQKVVPLVGNLSALLDFSASTESGRKAATATEVE